MITPSLDALLAAAASESDPAVVPVLYAWLPVDQGLLCVAQLPGGEQLRFGFDTRPGEAPEDTLERCAPIAMGQVDALINGPTA